jgi:hypothetical protein
MRQTGLLTPLVLLAFLSEGSVGAQLRTNQNKWIDHRIPPFASQRDGAPVCLMRDRKRMYGAPG